MTPESQYTAQARYDKENTRLVVLKLNRKTDADILLKLEETGNKQGYIKELVRKDIRGQQGSLSRDLIRYAVQPVAHKYGLDRVSLFGSYARGDATEGSDVDLLVEGGNIHNMKTFLELEEAFEAAIGKKVDVVDASLLQKDTRSARRFRERIKEDEVILYERIR